RVGTLSLAWKTGRRGILPLPLSGLQAQAPIPGQQSRSRCHVSPLQPSLEAAHAWPRLSERPHEVARALPGRQSGVTELNPTGPPQKLRSKANAFWLFLACPARDAVYLKACLRS